MARQNYSKKGNPLCGLSVHEILTRTTPTISANGSIQTHLAELSKTSKPHISMSRETDAEHFGHSLILLGGIWKVGR